MVKWLGCLLCSAPFLFSQQPSLSAVTYEFSGGRFGDCLISYLHAKWFAYQRGIAVIYKPFVHSINLVMDEAELRTHPCKSGYARDYLGKGVFPSLQRGGPEAILYICPYFPEDPWELANTTDLSGNPYYSFPVDWKDPGFRRAALEMVAPKRKLQLTELKKGVINVALHIREGGGYDFDDFRTRFPLKLPPLQFYIEGVRKILDLFAGKTVECYLFTDALDPGMLVRQIEEAIPSESQVHFRFRKGGNHFNRNVLEDFFSLFLFDVLIRPQSNFSMIPSLLKDFAVVYAPKECSVIDGVVRIEEVSLEIDPLLYEKLLQ